ncbi:hypothetical protein [Nostoc sp.]|uniref:hypothetical protein n=1 Tax=Nostoc sp. TaxID=1180 RepID=UPI002FF484BC
MGIGDWGLGIGDWGLGIGQERMILQLFSGKYSGSRMEAIHFDLTSIPLSF